MDPVFQVLGAYLAGLFFREEVASRELIQKVEDRLYGIAYSFLGPIFFISLGFHVKLDALTGRGLWLMVALAVACAVGQIVSAGGMARLLSFNRWASLGLTHGAIDEATFMLNLFVPLGLKACALKLSPARPAG